MNRIFRFAIATLILSTIFAPTAYADQGVNVGKMLLRNRVVTITSTPAGLKYSVLTKNGQVLDANLNEAELAAKHPAISDSLRESVAKSKPGQLMMLNHEKTMFK